MEKVIKFDGNYTLELKKNEDGNYEHISIHKVNEGGNVSPVLDFPVKLLQENSNIGIELSFNSKNMYIEE